MRRVRRLGRERDVAVRLEARPGKGNHGRLYFGERFATVKDRRQGDWGGVAGGNAPAARAEARRPGIADVGERRGDARARLAGGPAAAGGRFHPGCVPGYSGSADRGDNRSGGAGAGPGLSDRRLGRPCRGAACHPPGIPGAWASHDCTAGARHRQGRFVWRDAFAGCRQHRTPAPREPSPGAVPGRSAGEERGHQSLSGHRHLGETGRTLPKGIDEFRVEGIGKQVCRNEPPSATFASSSVESNALGKRGEASQDPGGSGMIAIWMVSP